MINIDNSPIENVLVGDVLSDRVYLGTDIVWEKQSPGRLPYGYTEIEYIESTLTGGLYIDLDITLYETLNKNYDLAIKFILYGAGQDNFTQPTIFGCQRNVDPWPGTFIRKPATNIRVQGRYIGANVKDNNIGIIGQLIELTEKTPPAKNVYNYNNFGLTHTWGTSLFCTFDPDKVPQRFAQARLYYFKLFVEGSLVRDMVPCKDPNDVVGLYDLVNDVFYSSPNGSAFSAGPDV